MMIHEITEKVGAHKKRKRVGRGRASGLGKTSGRGHKGAGSRAGHGDKIYFEGGQMPLVRRLPKRGFTNAAFRTVYQVVNVHVLCSRFENGAEVNAEVLAEKGLIRSTKKPVKILGQGEINKKLSVTAQMFSASAKSKIEAAGGTCVSNAKVKWTRAAAAAKKAEAQSSEG